jgi:hypothetical protein
MFCNELFAKECPFRSGMHEFHHRIRWVSGHLAGTANAQATQLWIVFSLLVFAFVESIQLFHKVFTPKSRSVCHDISPHRRKMARCRTLSNETKSIEEMPINVFTQTEGMHTLHLKEMKKHDLIVESHVQSLMRRSKRTPEITSIGLDVDFFPKQKATMQLH